MEKVGAYPQLALTRDEKTEPFGIFTRGTEAEYMEYAAEFQSPLFDFTAKNFRVKRKEFCFAGDWSGVLNLQTGMLSQCYANPMGANIFEDPDTPIPNVAVGRHCKHCYCVNSSHFMSLGVIPSIQTPTYGQLRNRKEAQWYTPEMEDFLNGKLKNGNSVVRSMVRHYVYGFQSGTYLYWMKVKITNTAVYQLLRRVKRKLVKMLRQEK